jgi:hypothetical protein
LAGAGLAEEAGKVGFGFVSADFLRARGGFHVTGLLNRPVRVKGSAWSGGVRAWISMDNSELLVTLDAR